MEEEEEELVWIFDIGPRFFCFVAFDALSLRVLVTEFRAGAVST